MSDLKKTGGTRTIKTRRFEPELNAEDLQYYFTMYQNKTLNLDLQRVTEYFPTDRTFIEMLKFYEQTFDITFKKVELPSLYPTNAHYELWSNGELYGYITVDLYPRQGKFTHFACFPIIEGYDDNPAWAILGCNFNEKLNFSELTTLLHEFGHAIHQVLGSKASPYYELNGLMVETDFVEAPSQILENWCYEADVLNKLSANTIPKDVREKIVAMKKFSVAFPWTRIATMALFDQKMHTSTDSRLANMYEKYIKMYRPDTMPGSYVASWGHLGCSGYAGKYYAYVWTFVLAADLYNNFDAARYKKIILECGGVRNASDMIRDYLGRDFNPHALSV